LLKSKLEQFIAKRVIVYFVVLSVIDILFIESKWFTLIGLLAGSVLTIVKFGSYSWVFGRILCVNCDSSKKESPGSVVLVFTLNQLLLIVLLCIAYSIDLWLFAGFVGGILLVPLTVMVNSITEAFGITKNHFE
jgi:hypothetical protein